MHIDHLLKTNKEYKDLKKQKIQDIYIYIYNIYICIYIYIYINMYIYIYNNFTFQCNYYKSLTPEIKGRFYLMVLIKVNP